MKVQNTKQISATEFKKHFLQLVDEVNNKKSSFTITKRKVPVAQVSPLDTESKNNQTFFGCMKGLSTIKGDIVNCSFELDWEMSND